MITELSDERWKGVILVPRAYDLLVSGWINNLKKNVGALGTRMEGCMMGEQKMRIKHRAAKRESRTRRATSELVSILALRNAHSRTDYIAKEQRQ